MTISGKQATLNRWQQRELKGINKAIKLLADMIRVVPLKDGRLAVMLGNPKEGNIQFFIDAPLVFEAAQAGLKFAEELKEAAEAGAGATEIVERCNEAATLPVGGE